MYFFCISKDKEKGSTSSAGLSLYEDCLWVNLSFIEQSSVSIFGICGFFLSLEVTFVHSSVNRVATFLLREGLTGLFCTGALRKLHTKQVS